MILFKLKRFIFHIYLIFLYDRIFPHRDAVFDWSKMKNIIYCPECARQIYIWDGKSTMSIEVGCKCGKFLRFTPNKEVKVIKRPERNSSSGVRFFR